MHACRVCVDPFGCGMSLNYSVAATVTGLSPDSPTQGGLAGGLVVTILGSGFGNDPAGIRARFGNVTCAVQSVNSTAAVCRIAPPSPPLGNVTSSAQSLALTAAPNAAEAQYPVVFSFTQALTAYVTAVVPASSCSAPGGATPLLVVIRGSNFVNDPPNLQVGAAEWLPLAAASCLCVIGALLALLEPGWLAGWGWQAAHIQ